MLEKHHAYSRAHFEDLPEIRDWVWADGRLGRALDSTPPVRPLVSRSVRRYRLQRPMWTRGQVMPPPRHECGGRTR